MEEDIKNLQEIISLCEEEIKNNDENITATLDLQDLKSLVKLLKENENFKEAAIINDRLYKEVWNKNKELEIEKEKLEDKVEYKNKIIRQQNDELGVLQAQLYSYKENLGDVCNKNAELEKELKHKNDLIKQADKDLEVDYVLKSLIKEIRDKAELEDYYTLPNVIDDLNKVLGDEE